MAALVQTYSQPTPSTTMLQTRPTPTGMLPNAQTHTNHQFMAGQANPRSPYHANGSGTSYRGTSQPVQQYAFTSTPTLNHGVSWQQYGPQRGNGAPGVAAVPGYDASLGYRGQFGNGPAMTYNYVPAMGGVSSSGSRDDSAIPTARATTGASRMQQVYASQASPAHNGKAAPDRYRRPTVQTSHLRSHSSTLPSNTGQFVNANQHFAGANSPSLNRPNSLHGSLPASSMDDSHVSRANADEASRMRRRSMHSFESSEGPQTLTRDKYKPDEAHVDSKNARPATAHSRNASSESVSSTRSGHSRPSSRPSSATNRNVAAPTGNPSLLSAGETNKQDQSRPIVVPARGASSDAAKRGLNPSPLSKPATMATDDADDTPAPGLSAAASANLGSPAARQLAALNQKGGRPKKTSRLRRAFSFGSAAELKQAAGTPVATAPTAAEDETTDRNEPSKLRKDPTPDEAYDAEQARIAEAQEAAGIGNSIYGGRFFGSTDNLSISSTASSASIMIRKMGRGMKKSTRSLVGLFRPKSVIGVPPPDLAPEASQAEVSMITVEAETNRVNVHPDPQGPDGGTGFPHLERNSVDAKNVPDMLTEVLASAANAEKSEVPRKSIMGGDKERAEVLAAVRKGILKRSGSPSVRPVESIEQLDRPSMRAVTDSPNSSAPSTPNDEAQGHRRTGSVTLANEDYFMSALRMRQDTKSAPTTPHGGTKRNATFSPRLIFHDTWPSQEYDRRGEVATCNRLTPMLAQQIKEELNTFKMEMEVHENSKIYTHFF